MLTLVIEVLLALVTILSAGHAFLYKRDPRAAWGWVAVCLMFPGGGAALYWLMGVNRIRTRARNWEAKGKFDHPITPAVTQAGPAPVADSSIAALVRIADTVTGLPCWAATGSASCTTARRRILRCGTRSPGFERVYLSTYIFRTDTIGRRFIDVLVAAAERGVDVRVLIDGVGELYTFPWASRQLRHTKVRVARFLPLVRRGFHFNLRNHRKLLVVDGRVGFAGGMNIGEHHLAEQPNKPHRVVDLQVGVEGPVVAQLEEVFLRVWHFATGDSPPVQAARVGAPMGHASCRGISAGPNEDFQPLIVLGALGAARRTSAS
jgi:cardiolipin synthase